MDNCFIILHIKFNRKILKMINKNRFDERFRDSIGKSKKVINIVLIMIIALNFFLY
jgi:hypothetical protein